MTYFALEDLSADEIGAIERKFNIDFFSLEPVGEGRWGHALAIDNKSILKITSAEEEVKVLKILISENLILEPGFATVLSEDILELQKIDVYRTERLYPAKKALKWAMKNNILDYKEVDSLNYKISIFLNDLFISPRDIHDFNLGKEGSTFLREPMLIPLVLSLYTAASKGFFLYDLHLGNLGFRFDENGNPALDAGFVAFDLMISKWGKRNV